MSPSERALADAEYTVGDLVYDEETGRVGILAGRTAPLAGGVLVTLFDVLEAEKQALADRATERQRAGKLRQWMDSAFKRVPKIPRQR
jgi:hypothetical protein